MNRLILLSMLMIISVAVRNSIGAEPPNVLDVPSILQQQQVDNLRAVALLRSGDHANAKLLLRQCVLRVPYDLMAVYNLACAYALLDEADEAIETLKAALKLGFRNKQQLQLDDDLAKLRDKPAFAEILKGCDEPPPKRVSGWNYDVQIAEPKSATLTVDHKNMSWNAATQVMNVFVHSTDSGKDRLVAGSTGALGDKIMTWYAEGTASGNVGDLYDNHDRTHSKLDPARYPQLTNLLFGPEVQKRQLDNGPQRLFLYVNASLKPGDKPGDKPADKSGNEKSGDKSGDKGSEQANGAATEVPSSLQVERTIVIGNSSTALTGSPFWRSMPRLILTSGGGPQILSQHYTNNHLYVYPEHKDHDPGHDDANGWGDTYFANTPFYLISQGSSYTDQPILDALAATLSAFHPDTKKALREKGLIAPTLQMIFRRCYRLVASDEAYLSSVAHPTVFEGSQVDADAMIEMAHNMKASELPPVAVLRILSESQFDPLRDYFDAQSSEAVLTTPFAIARVANATSFWRELVITAADSLDANKRPLQFHWVILRGDENLIKIENVPGNADARRVRIGYHKRRPIQSGSSIESSRVDIAVFAHNGVYYSAPSFISVLFPDNEARVYDEQQRIVSVDHLASAQHYVDPVLIPERLWKDEYHYDALGKLTGWTRKRGSEQEEFNASGELLLPNKADGAATTAKRVLYQRVNHPDGRPYILQKNDAE